MSSQVLLGPLKSDRDRVQRIGWLALALVLICAPGARAQDHGRVGVALGYPASLGLEWHVTNRVAIRPDFSFAGSSFETTSPPIMPIGGFTTTSSTSTSDSRNLGVGLSALFFVHRWDNLRVYVSPRIAYSDTHSTSETTVTSGLPGIPIAPFRTESDGSAINGSGSFGAHYTLSPRFAVSGEFGFAYSDLEITGSPATRGTTQTVRSWGMRSAVGVTVYVSR